MKIKQLNIRVEEKYIDALKDIAKEESTRFGYKISMSGVIRKAISEFIDKK
jgi:hypothetical protein